MVEDAAIGPLGEPGPNPFTYCRVDLHMCHICMSALQSSVHCTATQHIYIPKGVKAALVWGRTLVVPSTCSQQFARHLFVHALYSEPTVHTLPICNMQLTQPLCVTAATAMLHCSAARGAVGAHNPLSAAWHHARQCAEAGTGGVHTHT